MPDEKPTGPDYKPTTPIEKPPAWAIGFAEKLQKGFDAVNARLAGIETTVDTLVEDGNKANVRMTTIEVRLDEYEKRAANNSVRVKQSSEVDAKHDAELANERSAREELAKKVEDLDKKTDAQTRMLEKAGSFLKDPKVLLVGAFLYTLLKGFAAKHGVELP